MLLFRIVLARINYSCLLHVSACGFFNFTANFHSLHCYLVASVFIFIVFSDETLTVGFLFGVLAALCFQFVLWSFPFLSYDFSRLSPNSCSMQKCHPLLLLPRFFLSPPSPHLPPARSPVCGEFDPLTSLYCFSSFL